jgi:predicted dehydrogenase
VGQPLRIGVVGCGVISGAYLETFPRLPGLKVTAVADLVAARAESTAAKWPGVRALALDDLLAGDDVDAVVNLTLPAAHAAVAHAAIAAGKHVYGEKPLAATVQESEAIVRAAAEAGVRAGCAPDTVLGVGVQTARRCIDEGGIGTPLAATAFMTTPGHERWHHRPEFYYQPGGGPLLDMGPYYLTALVHLLGPVRRVVGASSRPRRQRVIGSGPAAGATFAVETDTHVTGIIEHASGVLSTIIMSFDVWAAHLPRVEVYGTQGSISVPDPNRFDGPVGRYRPDTGGWEPVAASAGYTGASRGYGVADMARAIETHRPHRASADIAHHVLDTMVSLLEASRLQRSLDVQSTCSVPELVVPGIPPEEA